MKGTSGEEWVTPLEKMMRTYTLPDGSAIESTDFIPVDTVVIVETAWGDVLTANNPLVVHGEGDYLVCRPAEDGSPDLSDVWVVNGATFPDTYDMTNAD